MFKISYVNNETWLSSTNLFYIREEFQETFEFPFPWRLSEITLRKQGHFLNVTGTLEQYFNYRNLENSK